MFEIPSMQNFIPKMKQKKCIWKKLESEILYIIFIIKDYVVAFFQNQNLFQYFETKKISFKLQVLSVYLKFNTPSLNLRGSRNVPNLPFKTWKVEKEKIFVLIQSIDIFFMCFMIKELHCFQSNPLSYKVLMFSPFLDIF